MQSLKHSKVLILRVRRFLLFHWRPAPLSLSIFVSACILLPNWKPQRRFSHSLGSTMRRAFSLRVKIVLSLSLSLSLCVGRVDSDRRVVLLTIKDRLCGKDGGIGRRKMSSGREAKVGTLKVRVIRGRNLAMRDLRGSDPYVIVRAKNQVLSFSLILSPFLSLSPSLSSS